MFVKRIITIGITVILLLQFACQDNGVTPPPPPKDPRTYTFTVDTIAIPDAFQTNMQDIAGTAANNVFTVGHNSSSRAGTMFRYDGTSWKTTGYHLEEGGPITGGVDLASLLAFSSNNIWFVGARSRLNPTPPPNFIDSSFILQYDGRTWTEHKAYGSRGLLSIHGIAPNDIWACGFHGTLLHYNGVRWERDSIPMAVPEGGEYILRDIVKVSSEFVYALGQVSKPGDITMFYFFRRAGATWTVLDSTLDGNYAFGYVDLWASPAGVLYSLGPFGIWRWNGTKWTTILDWNGEPLQRIWGYSDASFFVGGYRTLLHYNGRDFYQYPDLMDDVVYWGIWGDGNEMFVAANDGRKSFVYHGR